MFLHSCIIRFYHAYVLVTQFCQQCQMVMVEYAQDNLFQHVYFLRVAAFKEVASPGFFF